MTTTAYEDQFTPAIVITEAQSESLHKALIASANSVVQPLHPAPERTTPMPDLDKLARGLTVRKKSGYAWPGVIVAVFQTLGGQTRVVVECTAHEFAGALHIYSPEQIEVTRAD